MLIRASAVQFGKTGQEMWANVTLRQLELFVIFNLHQMIVLDIRASAFLHHMVRNIAGVLMTIGTGERPVEWMKEVLESPG